MAISDALAGPRLAGPVPPDKPVSLLQFLREGPDNIIGIIPRAAYEQPVWETSFGTQRAFFINDPAGVKQVMLDNVANYPKAPEEIYILGAAFGEGLLTSDGEKWRSHRRIMAPSFDFRSIVSYAPAMTGAAEEFAAKWDALAPGTPLDIGKEMSALTLQIISRTMFSTDASGLNDLVGETLERGMAEMNFGLLDAVPVLGPWRVRRRVAKIQQIFGALDKAMLPLIQSRAARKTESGTPDLLDRLIAARDSDTGGALSTQEVRDEAVIIYLAGHETTAVAMTFVWYLLSQHPDAEAKLHAELDSVLGGRAPAYDDLAKLPYTRMVIEEAMRLYPPAPGLSARVAQADDVVSGVRIPKGAPVLLSPWVLHRHRALWDAPERFDPERFSPERSAGRPRFAYMPFGAGPRICIGASLAMTEACLILAAIAQRYRLRLVPGQEIELRHRITLRPKTPIRMVVEKR